jgi:hypothetical protein
MKPSDFNIHPNIGDVFFMDGLYWTINNEGKCIPYEIDLITNPSNPNAIMK